MKFLQEIIESRMYRRLDMIKGTDVGTIADMLFDHLIMLRLLYYIDKPAAMRYARDTMANPSFNGYRQSMPDLYNFITFVINQRQFADKLFNDWDITIPELRLKRMLRSIADGDLDEVDNNALLMLVQRRLKGLSADQIWARRLVQDWIPKYANRQDRKNLITRLLQAVRRPISTDLYMQLMKSARNAPDSPIK